MPDWRLIAAEIAGNPDAISNVRSVAGGSINAAFRVDCEGEPLFIKTNRASLLDMFIAERDGLAAMAATNTIRTPLPVAHGVAGDQCFIALEFLRFGGGGDMAEAGAQFAAMHRHQAERYGWPIDNTIGSTSQPNGWRGDWVAFLRDRRLGHQLRLAASQGYGGLLQSKGQQLLNRLDDFFDVQPAASLLHGDLWSGNFAFDDLGQPCFFDPACYYGDREADFAMTELFGGFGPKFRSGYDEVWPLADGYSRRKDLYQLYHILNHLNLFGGSYLGQAMGLLDRLRN